MHKNINIVTYIQFHTLWMKRRIVYTHCWLCGGFHDVKNKIRFLKKETKKTKPKSRITKGQLMEK